MEEDMAGWGRWLTGVDDAEWEPGPGLCVTWPVLPTTIHTCGDALPTKLPSKFIKWPQE